MTVAHILRHAGMGDVLYAEPVVRAVAATGHYAAIHMHCWGWFADVFRNHPCLALVEPTEASSDGLITRSISMYEVSYCLDGVYETQWRCRNYQHISKLYLQHFGLPEPDPVWPRLYISEAQRGDVAPLLPAGRLLVISAASRCLFPVEQWEPILEAARRLGFVTVGVGIHDCPLRYDCDLRNRLTVSQLCAVIDAAEAVVVLESGPLVIADALHKRGVALLFDSVPRAVLRADSRLAVVACTDLELDYVGLLGVPREQRGQHLKVSHIVTELEKLS